MPTNTPATGLTVYTSPDHLYHISYPTGWQAQTADGNPGTRVSKKAAWKAKSGWWRVTSNPKARTGGTG